ncbi:MAG: ABC transporter substrate-binding protein [Cyclobacteriaceae bacterium]
MIELKIGGVPEHFNMPWHLLLQSGKLAEKEIAASWTDFSGGTGAMVEALNNNQVDLAMLLTEGAVSGIDKRGSFKIISFYVSSPLVWGIHVPADSPFQTMNEVKGQRYAISRYGSGSHLMSFVDAKSRDWPLSALRFELVGNLDGARQALKEKKAEIFLWEKFTTKPYVDNGEFRRIDECPTPFDCFVICASQKALEQKEKAIYQTVKKVFKTAAKLYIDPMRSAIIANHYHLMEEDVEIWLDSVSWTEKIDLEKKTLKKVITTLSGLDLIKPDLKYKDLVWKLGKL